MKAGIVFIAGLMASALHAQSCKASLAPWMLVQTQTLSEEDGAWNNDSLRKVLLMAANMKSGAVEPQLGRMLKIDEVTPLASALEALDYLRKQAGTPGSATCRIEAWSASPGSVPSFISFNATRRFCASRSSGWPKPDLAKP